MKNVENFLFKIVLGGKDEIKKKEEEKKENGNDITSSKKEVSQVRIDEPGAEQSRAEERKKNTART